MTGGVVVLGAQGKLGRLLAPFWPDDVTCFGRQDCDILDQARLVAALRGAQAVLCLAGVTHGSDLPLSLNTTLAALTLDAAQAAGAGHVFLMSSAAVYGRAEGVLDEDMAPTPVAPYGTSKAEMEAMAARHAHPNTCLRLANVAGADAILGGWGPSFTLDTFDDGSTPRRSYIGLQSLAHVLRALAAQADVPGILNVASVPSLAMGDLLTAADLAWAPRRAPPEAIPNVTLDTRRLDALVEIPDRDRTAAAMVTQWKRATA